MIDIHDYFFHDAEILGIKQIPEENIVEFQIYFPVDWENNKFEKRLLIFYGVLHYINYSGYFHGNPTILAIDDLMPLQYDTVLATKTITIITNAGNQVISYKTCDVFSLT